MQLSVCKFAKPRSDWEVCVESWGWLRASSDLKTVAIHMAHSFDQETGFLFLLIIMTFQIALVEFYKCRGLQICVTSHVLFWGLLKPPW